MGITIVGAGAIGGTLGAYLGRGGADVTLVDRDADHVASINARGLRITGYEEFTVPVRAITPEQISSTSFAFRQPLTEFPRKNSR